MDFKEKIIYIIIGLLIFTNIIWLIDRMYIIHEAYNYDCSITNENKNLNDNMKGDE